MKILQLIAYGGPDNLKLVDIPAPKPVAGQVLVRVQAASLNPIDLGIASGAMQQDFPVQLPWTPGADFAGVIESVGDGVTAFQVGDEVYGCTPLGGSYTEQVVADAKLIAMKPTSLSPVEAASLATVAQTAKQALDTAKLQASQTILIHGGSGGVGSLAVQLAHARGARVIATASGANVDLVKSLGADEVIDYRATQFESVVKDVDVVLDGVGGDTQTRSYGVIKPGGYLITLNAPPSPDEVAKHNVNGVMLQTHASHEDLEAIARDVEAGKLKPLVAKTFPLAEAPTVWAQWPTLHVAGKVVFTV